MQAIQDRPLRQPPKGFEQKLTEKLGEVPYGFDIELDKKGKLTGEPVLLKKASGKAP